VRLHAALQRAFKHHTLVVALLLKLAANVVENHVSYLKPEEAGALLQWVLVLLQQYAEDNQWVKQGTASKSLVVRLAPEPSSLSMPAGLLLIPHP